LNLRIANDHGEPPGFPFHLIDLQRFNEPLITVLTLDAVDWHWDYAVGNCWAVDMVNLPLNLNPNHFAVPTRTEQGHLVRPSVCEPLGQNRKNIFGDHFGENGTWECEGQAEISA
jgi:hypothetical protein